jgi:DNA invertase Pin-like site-specific DNA recombinase
MLRPKFDPQRPHRYVRYGRMSSDQQNPRSPEQQFDTIDRLVKGLGRPWVHVRDYRDDGVSGRYVSKRSGLQEMLQEIRSGRLAVDLILVDTFERFGRAEELAGVRQELYTRDGVLILTADSQFADPTTVQGRALALVESIRSTEDTRVKAHNVLRGKRDAARQKQWPGGPTPFGYKLQSVLCERGGRQEVSHCILVPDPETSWIVQLLFRLAGEKGWGISRLAKFLNDNMDISERFKPFHPTTIGYWLDNPIYYGELLWEQHATGVVNDQRVIERNPEEDMLRVPDFCAPLVTREVWEAVASIREERGRRFREARKRRTDASDKQLTAPVPGLALKYLLTGLVRCGHCDRSMTPSSSGVYVTAAGESRRYVTYVCPGRLAGVCPNDRRVPEPWLRETVMELIRRRLFSPEE